MLHTNIFKLLSLIVSYFLLMILDASLGVHTMSTGFLLALLLFTPISRTLLLLLFLTLTHDVRFALPLGGSFVGIVPFYFVLPYLIKVLRSRFVVLLCYLIIVSLIFSLTELGELMSFSTLLKTGLSAFGWVFVVYLYALRRYQDFSFSTKQKHIRFD